MSLSKITILNQSNMFLGINCSSYCSGLICVADNSAGRAVACNSGRLGSLAKKAIPLNKAAFG